jgi:hypothetical protein
MTRRLYDRHLWLYDLFVLIAVTMACLAAPAVTARLPTARLLVGFQPQ